MRALLFVLISVVAACGGTTSEPDSGTTLDAGARDLGAPDLGPPDLGPPDMGRPCTLDSDCDDGRYCNGAERCTPGGAGADARGCVTAGSSPCNAMQTCDETMRRCVATSCDGSAADMDGDGHRSIECGGDDCADTDANRYPGNHEVCDGTNHDEDCDSTTFGFRDSDGDGVADAACCNADGTGTLHCGTDCNDGNASVHPGATEVCNGIDDNCDGMVDEGVVNVYHADTDGDGFGDPTAPTRMGCSPPAGYVVDGTDCNDHSPSVHPGAMEICDLAMVDENCNGTANEGCLCAGATSMPCPGVGGGPALGACAAGMESCASGVWTACSVLPTAETCNGIDDDCNGIVDNGVTSTCYPDDDGDSYAAAGAAAVARCSDPTRLAYGGCPAGYTGRAPLGGEVDCNDMAATAYPLATEICNAADDNCDGIVDNLASAGANYCTSGSAPRACTDPACGGAAGTQSCTACSWGACTATVRTCSPGSLQPCMTAGHTCYGVQGCQAMCTWGTCQYIAESCDYTDQDCNGMIDDGVSMNCSGHYSSTGVPLGLSGFAPPWSAWPGGSGAAGYDAPSGTYKLVPNVAPTVATPVMWGQTRMPGGAAQMGQSTSISAHFSVTLPAAFAIGAGGNGAAIAFLDDIGGSMVTPSMDYGIPDRNGYAVTVDISSHRLHLLQISGPTRTLLAEAFIGGSGCTTAGVHDVLLSMIVNLPGDSVSINASMGPGVCIGSLLAHEPGLASWFGQRAYIHFSAENETTYITPWAITDVNVTRNAVCDTCMPY